MSIEYRFIMAVLFKPEGIMVRFLHGVTSRVCVDGLWV